MIFLVFKTFFFDSSWVETLMANALLAMNAGCLLSLKDKGITLENENPDKRINPEKDCVMQNERYQIYQIEQKMTDTIEEVRIYSYLLLPLFNNSVLSQLLFSLNIGYRRNFENASRR